MNVTWFGVLDRSPFYDASGPPYIAPVTEYYMSVQEGMHARIGARYGIGLQRLEPLHMSLSVFRIFGVLAKRKSPLLSMALLLGLVSCPWALQGPL